MSSPTEHRQVRFAPPPGATEFLIVRHGASAPFRPGEPFPLRDGHGDPPLAPEGHEQAEQVGMRLAGEPVDAIYVTTLQRTHQTAAPLAARLGITPIVEADLREVFLGDWEGGLFRARAAELDPAYVRMQADQEWGHIPGAETTAALRARCVGAIARLHERHREQRVVVVAHGGVIAALLAHAAGSAPFAFMGADNGSIHHVIVLDDRWILRCFNDTGHLGPFTSAGQALT
jgi:probable phosphoglycerate mutase